MAELSDDLWTWEKAELIDRVRELEGLLASTTRNLESCQRELADAMINPEPVALRGQLVLPEHLAMLDRAIERLATWLADDTGMEADDLMAQVKDTSETALSVIATSIVTLATARERLTPKPLAPLR